MIGMDSNNSNNKHAHEMALEFVVSSFTMNPDRAHQLAHEAICLGKEFSMEFFSSVYFHLCTLNETLRTAEPNASKLISELSIDLENAHGTNFWDAYANGIGHPDYKLSDKLKEVMGSEWKSEWK